MASTASVLAAPVLLAKPVATTASTQATPAQELKYDEQFLLQDGNGTPLVDMFYTAKLPSGELAHGKTDKEGLTERFYTDAAQTIEIHFGHLESL